MDQKTKIGIIAAGTAALVLIVIYNNRIMAYLKGKTWDWKSNQVIDDLHPAIRDMARIFINRADKELGIKLRAYSGLRTFEEQADLYAQGRDKSGSIVTNAQPGQSYHNYGLALDVVEIKDGKALWSNPRWPEIAKLGKEIGFEWGGDWTGIDDKPHFQWTGGRHWSDLKTLYNQGDREGPYVNLA